MRKNLPSHGRNSAIYVADPSEKYQQATSSNNKHMFRRTLLPKSLATFLKQLYPQQIQSLSQPHDYYFIPESVSTGVDGSSVS
jgi:hypothetical protein